MIDIKAKLIPNLLTLLTQLCATGIIYVLYRKYLHEPVMKWLDKQRDELQESQLLAKEVEEQAVTQKEELDKERIKMLAEIENYKEKMLAEVQEERKELLAAAKEEAAGIVEQGHKQATKEKEQMLEEVQQYVVNLAAVMTKKVLENYEVNEKMMMLALEEEMSKLNEKR